MSLTTDGAQLTMPVMPAGSYGGNNNGGWGENGSWWIILFLIWAIFGIGNNGWGGNGGMNGAATQGALTREQACIDNNFNNLMRETAGIADSVNLGFSNLNSTICNAAYENAGLINGLSNTVQQGFNGTNVALLQGFNAVQSQAAQCCCDQKAATADLKYTIASEDCATRSTIQNGLRDSIENANANARAILQKLDDQAMEAKNAQIAALNQQLFAAQLSASQSAQTNQIVSTLRPFPVAAYQVCNPFTGTYGGYQGYGSGCGCNVGCGCGTVA